MRALPVLLSVLSLPCLAAAVPVKDSRIVEVTVFPDRAEVVREARVDLPAGGTSVELADMPYDVDPDSLRVSAKGVPAVLGAVELRERAAEPSQSPEWLAAQEGVKNLERQIAALDAQARIATQLGNFLTSIQATTAKNASENLGAGKADPPSIQGVYALLRSNLESLAKDDLDRQREREHADRDLQVARARLAAMRPAGAIRSRVATVEVETRQAGALTLRLAYLVRGASWRPSYRAALDLGGQAEVSLTSEAVVRQSTGEDWRAVALRLSTATPARGVEPPPLEPWLLRPAVLEGEKDNGDPLTGQSLGRIYQSVIGGVSSKAEPPLAPPPPETNAEYATADVVHSAYNVAFEVPGTSDIPADGSEHRVVLRQETLAAAVEYRSVPAVNAAAYLTAVTHAPADYPLLAGSVRTYVGGAFLGSFQVRETAPGAELTLPFGVDNRIKVERVTLPQVRGREGLGGKTREIAYTFRTTLENLSDRAVNLVLEDRVPVSEDERIVVETGKETTSGSQPSERRPGVLLWKFDLAPKAKRELRLAYTVRLPRDLSVPGIE